MTRRTPGVVSLAALIMAGALVHVPVASAAPVNADSLRLDGLESYIGLGEPVDVTDADATFSLSVGGTTGGAVVNVTTADHQWWLGFQPPEGQTLTVGHYANAGGQVPLTPGLGITRDSSGCNAPSGSFTVHSIEYDVGVPVSLAVSFEHLCEPNSDNPLTGTVRVNSATPMPALASPTTNRQFGNVTVGEVTAAKTFIVESFGDLPVTVTSIARTGAGGADFSLTQNGCTGAVLDPGETCSFKIAFAPSASGARPANLVINNNSPEGARVLFLGGFGRTPTVTGVSVQPEWTYNLPGLLFVAAVSPTPDGIELECLLDGEVIEGGWVFGLGLVCLAPRTLGTHDVRAHYLGTPTQGLSLSAPVTFTASDVTSVDLTASKTSLGAGAPVTLTATVSTASNLLYPGSPVTFKDLTTNQVLGSGAISYGSATVSIAKGFAAGTHQIQASYGGVAGILKSSSDSLTLTVLPDTVAPSTTTPSHAFVNRSRMDSSGRIPVKLKWSGSDALSGVAGYEVSRQTDGGTWGAPAAASTPTLTASLSTGHGYQFRVRAVDYAGNRGAWKYGSTIRLTRYSEASALVRYTASWSKVGGGPYWGGTAMKSSAAGGKAQFTFTGRSFAWLTLLSPTRGKAAIYVNGAYQTTVDLSASSSGAWAVGWSKTWSTTATRTLEVRVLGTAGRPRIDVDGFWVSR